MRRAKAITAIRDGETVILAGLDLEGYTKEQVQAWVDEGLAAWHVDDDDEPKPNRKRKSAAVEAPPEVDDGR